MRWFVGGSPLRQTYIKAEVSQNHQGSIAKIVILEELCRRHESILHSVSSLYHTIQNLDSIDWQSKSDVHSEDDCVIWEELQHQMMVWRWSGPTSSLWGGLF